MKNPLNRSPEFESGIETISKESKSGRIFWEKDVTESIPAEQLEQLRAFIVTPQVIEKIPEKKDKAIFKTSSDLELPDASEVYVEALTAASRELAEDISVLSEKIGAEVAQNTEDLVKKLFETKPEITKEIVDEIRSLPLNWTALKRLGQLLNHLSEGAFDTCLTSLKLPQGAGEFMPMIASVVANRNNPEVPVVKPTLEQINRVEPLLRQAEQLIGLVSPKWAAKFRSYIERKGADAIVDIGNKIADTVEIIEEIENPREQFVKEIAAIYEFFQSETLNKYGHPVPFESKVRWFFDALLKVRNNPDIANDTSFWLNNRDFPILLKLLPSFGVPPESWTGGDSQMVSIASFELMQALEIFLKQMGVRDVKPAPQPKEFDIFDPDTWERGLAEFFASEKLEMIKTQLPQILALTTKVLPTNGPEFAREVFKLAESLAKLSLETKSQKIV